MPGARIRFWGTIHDDLDPNRPRPLRRRIVADAELQSDRPRPGVKRERFVDDSPGRCRVAENVHHVDGLRNIRQSLEERRSCPRGLN